MAQQTPRLPIPDYSDMLPITGFNHRSKVEHIIQIADWDPDCLGYADATVVEGTHPTTRTFFVYKDEKGIWAKFVVVLPSQFAFSGITPTWPYATKTEEEKTIDAINGFQIQYQFCSSLTLDNPTDEEQKALQFIECLKELMLVAFKYECSKPRKPVAKKGEPEIKLDPKKKYAIVPACVTNAYNTVKQDGLEPNDFIKPIAEHPNKVDKDGKKLGGKDENKSVRAFLPLEFYAKKQGKEAELKCIIDGYERKNGKLIERQDKTGLKYRDVKSHVKPAVRVDGIWWGSHMQQQWIASAQFKIVHIQVTPVVENTQQKRYFAARPELEAPDDDYDEADAEFEDPNPSDESLGFSVGAKKALPNGDSENPMDEIKNMMKEAQHAASAKASAEDVPEDEDDLDEEPEPEPEPEKKKKDKSKKDKTKKHKSSKA